MTNVDLNNCANCPVHNMGNLKKLGIDMSNFDFVVALAGNPNTGKSTVFNYLTEFKLVDLPGTYSLLSTSTDEEVARDFILFGQPDVTVIVVDATRVERNLNLVLQILEITDRAVLALNLMDEAERNGIKVDDRTLAKELGIPVIGTSARQGRGMDELLNMIHQVATGKYICKPYRIKSNSMELNSAIEKLSREIEIEYPGLPNLRWVALRLLEGDQSIINSIRSGELGNLKKDFAASEMEA
jgi:ferrous iron transport protein B